MSISLVFQSKNRWLIIMSEQRVHRVGEEGFPMETLFAAIVGELASRSVSFLIDKYLKPPAPSKEEFLRGLQRMLLRLRVTVEEAEGRHITSHAMLQQLNVLREEMYRGCYVLDTFRRQAHEEEEMAQGHEVSDYLALSKFNPAKRIRFSAGSRHGTGELEQVVDNLGAVITDMIEFVVLLKNYPMMHRQPYSTYMYMEKCMFGRQMETERVVNFLLHIEPPAADNLGVLPIIGPEKVGKSTLVEHVCCDERVRNHFSRIIFLCESDFRQEKSLRDGVTRHRHSSSNDERFLVVIELAGDVDEGAFRRLYSASQSSLPHGSKIIVTSRSNRITKFGTTQALRLRFLSREAYWYFFKALAFGSSDPEEQPKLASLAVWMFDGYFGREKYKEFTGPFIDLSNLASLVRAGVDERKKRGLLEHRAKLKVTKTQPVPSRGGPSDSGIKSKFIFLLGIAETTRYCELYDQYRVGLAHEEAPKITMQDVMSGDAPHGKFECVLWKSQLPPYYSYIYSCEIRELKHVATDDKICQKRKVLS